MRERFQIRHSLKIAVEISERPALAAENTCHPTRPAGHVEQIAELERGRHRKSIPNVAMPLADHGQVDGEHQRAAAGGHGALEERMREAAILRHIELEPKWCACGYCHVL